MLRQEKLSGNDCSLYLGSLLKHEVLRKLIKNLKTSFQQQLLFTKNFVAVMVPKKLKSS